MDGHLEDSPERRDAVSWEDALLDECCRRRLCDKVVGSRFAVILVPPDVREAATELQLLAAQFFCTPLSDRKALGRLRLFGGGVVGYRELFSGASQFLELHAMEGGIYPKPKKPAKLRLLAEQYIRNMQSMARILIGWLAEFAGVPAEAFLQTIDAEDFGNLQEGECGSSVLRLCSHGVPCENSVSFDEHTDASFITLAALGSVPGLQVRDTSGAWLDVERGFCAEDGCLLVLLGDFLEVLSDGFYKAACHRVLAPAGRLSLPFLVRGQPEKMLSTAAFLDTDSGLSLRRIEAMTVKDMRRFLDMKGRQRFSGHRLLTDGERLPT